MPISRDEPHDESSHSMNSTLYQYEYCTRMRNRVYTVPYVVFRLPYIDSTRTLTVTRAVVRVHYSLMKAG